MQGVCSETRNRTRVALYAYAYEIQDDPLVSDSEYDELCNKIDLTQFTGNEELDLWFIANFNPCTGQWVHDHPGIDRLSELYMLCKPEEVNLEDMF